jgi:beta-glucosidase/6-phospho-beta-glucosidase/beta-galactosidase
LAVTPVFMRRMVNWLADQYGRDLPIYVTENGFSDRQGNLDDMHRIYYYKHYINQLLKGITDNV